MPRQPVYHERGEAALAVILAIQLVTIFVVTPLSATASVSVQLIELLRLGLAAVMILILARRWFARAAIAAATLGTLAASLQWQVHAAINYVVAAKLVLTVIFDGTVAVMVAMVVFRQGRVTVLRILGAVILYLYVALIFAGLYRLVTLLLPGAIAGLPPDPRARFAALLYLSLGTLTTNGTGDLAAIDPLVRSIVSLEAVIGQLFPATLLARLVTLHAAASGSRD